MQHPATATRASPPRDRRSSLIGQFVRIPCFEAGPRCRRVKPSSVPACSTPFGLASRGLDSWWPPAGPSLERAPEAPWVDTLKLPRLALRKLQGRLIGKPAGAVPHRISRTAPAERPAGRSKPSQDAFLGLRKTRSASQSRGCRSAARPAEAGSGGGDPASPPGNWLGGGSGFSPAMRRGPAAG